MNPHHRIRMKSSSTYKFCVTYKRSWGRKVEARGVARNLREKTNAGTYFESNAPATTE